LAKYFIKVKQIKTGREWEEPLTSMFVTKDSPHFETHEVGIHKIPNNLKQEQVRHYAENIIKFFNAGLREGESPRELLAWRIEK
jgi:hypothetical protein